MGNFADNLKKIRRSARLSQEELARRMDVAQSTVGMWESGRRTPRLSDIKKLAGILNITAGNLMEDTGQKIEIIKNAVYVDGKKVRELDNADINDILAHIENIRNKKTAPEAGGPGGPPLPGGKKILVIDDEQEICELLYSFLVPHNYKVFVTFNGQMGLEYFQEIRPDVVLLDLSMPDMDGIDVLKIIRKISDVPVFIITSHPQDIVDIHLKDLHIDGYIPKPFSLEDILNTLKHTL